LKIAAYVLLLTYILSLVIIHRLRRKNIIRRLRRFSQIIIYSNNAIPPLWR